MPTMFYTFVNANGTGIPDVATLTTDLGKIRALGIDVITDYTYPSTANYQNILEAAYAVKVKVMLNLQPWTHLTIAQGGFCTANNTPQYDSITNIVNQFKSHPALYGYYCDDETQGSVYSIATRIAVYNHIKSLDPNPRHYVYEAHYDYFPDAYSPQAHDIYGVDSYPYSDYDPANEAQALNEFQAILHKFAPFVGSDKIFAVLQAFSDGATDAAIFNLPPTGAQSRMWARVQAEGLDYWGVCWFIWLTGSSTWRTIDDYPWLQAEIYDIARFNSELLYPPALTTSFVRVKSNGVWVPAQMLMRDNGQWSDIAFVMRGP